jgi:2-desacetyl-2-hydroxyethyl bacteriochlorophyllide A dehydrogenase
VIARVERKRLAHGSLENCSVREIVLQEPGSLAFRDGAECAARKPGEALVRIHRIGVCGTDIHAFHGRQPFFTYPRVLGHELGVEVLEADSIPPGTSCALEPYLNNPESGASKMGKTNCCEDLEVLGVHTDGGMRRHLIVPEHKLHPSEELTRDQLALVETLCIGAHAIERGAVEKDDFCVVIGAGPIGLGCAAFARQHTDSLAVVDVSQARLETCQKTISPPPHTIDPAAGPIDEQLRAVSGGRLPSVILDATGNQKSMESCIEFAAHGARIVFVGLFQGAFSVHDPTFHRKELSILSSRNAPAETFRSVIDSISCGALDPEVWITHRMAFDDVPGLFSGVSGAPDLVKAIIEVD